MARKPPRLKVTYHERAIRALQQIWNGNADEDNVSHADQYVAFLKSNADRLATHYMDGRSVPTRPEFQFMTIKSSTRGHGHVAVYRVHGDSVEVMDFFHTAQDWQTHIQEPDER